MRWGKDQLGEGVIPDLMRQTFDYQSLQVGSTLFRRACLEQVDYMRPEADGCEDFDLLVRLAIAGYQGYFLPEFLMEYRFHGGQTSLKQNLHFLWAKAFCIDSYRFPDAQLEALRLKKLAGTQQDLGLRLIENGDTQEGRTLLKTISSGDRQLPPSVIWDNALLLTAWFTAFGFFGFSLCPPERLYRTSATQYRCRYAMTQHQRLIRLNIQTFWLLFFGGAIALSLYAAGFNRELVNPGGFPLLWRFFRASLQPDLSPQLLRLTAHAALTTLAYAVCGTFASVVLGAVGGVLTSQVWWQTVLPRWGKQPWVAGRLLLAFPRAIHELIWGLFFVNIWGLDPLVAIGAIALPYGAIVAKVFSEILDDTPRHSLTALQGSGVPPLTALLYSLIPQAFLNLLSYTFYRFECSIRAAAVLGIIGAGGLGYEILLSLQSLRYEQLWTFFYALGAVDGSGRRWQCITTSSFGVRESSGFKPPQASIWASLGARSVADWSNARNSDRCSGLFLVSER